MRKTGIRVTALSLAIASSIFISGEARAARHKGHAVRRTTGHHLVQTAAVRHGGYGHVIQCVAFAKTASDVVLHGNAADWWYNASGVYSRGQAPEAGSVLSFRATRRMPLGHVAVVTAIEDSRTIVIDQSHWAQRGISRNVHVVDVSPNNDWSAVRVALNGHPDSFGSIYPTHGFIYPRADDGSNADTPHVVMASNRVSHVTTHGAIDMTVAHPSTLATEVAEAPEDSLSDDAPNRNIR